jgi:hypothetical protein
VESDLSKRIGCLEKTAGVEMVEIDIEGNIYRMPRVEFRKILHEISDAGGDVGPGPSKPCFPTTTKSAQAVALSGPKE